MPAPSRFVCVIFLSVLFLCFISNSLFAALEAEWKYNEGNGQVIYDDTSHNNDLTRGSTSGSDVNDPNYSSDNPLRGTNNYSMSFDGLNDFLWINNNSYLKPSNDYTLATWVKLSTLSLGDQDIMISNIGAYNNSGGYQLLFNMSGGTSYLTGMYRPYVSGNYPDRAYSLSLSSIGLQANSWYHVAATFDASGGNTTVKLYLDGKPLGSSTLSGTISYNNTPYFFLGTNYDGDGYLGTFDRELNGYMDETSVYDHDMSDSSVRNLAEIDLDWASASNGSFSTKTNWNIQKTPSYASNVTLPNYGTPYTVSLDVNSQINDLHVDKNSTLDLGTRNIEVELGGDIDGILRLGGGVYSANSNLTMGTDGLIIGYGSINRDISNNAGTIKAQGNGQQLSVSLESHDSEGTLSADQGSTLYISNAHDITNRDTVSLSGGTLKGNAGVYSLINAGSDEIISGYGVIDDFEVNVGTGSLTATGNGKTLTLNEGFTSDQSSGTINVDSGAALNVIPSWTNYATINMMGGSITGGVMGQGNGATGLNVLSGINNIQNVNFFSGSKNTLSGSSTLNITGTGTLSGATISESGTGGNFNINSGATVQGYGTINPDMINNGSLISNVNSKTLSLNGALNVGLGRSVYATNSGTLTTTNTVINQGNIYANSNSIVNINNSLTNSGYVYSNGGTVNINSQVYNRNYIYSDSGTVNIFGAVKAGSSETGEFYANSGQMNITGTIESGSRNIFSAYNLGTLKMPDGFSTGLLYLTEALRPRGGLITLNNNQTLTNVFGKTIKGYGSLLNNTCNLINNGLIEADGGLLTVYGDLTNSGIIKSDGTGDSLNIGGLIEVADTGSLFAKDGGNVNVGNDIVNNGHIYAVGSEASIALGGNTPAGSGYFSADSGGKIQVNNGFTNANMSNSNPIRLAGGSIEANGGTVTNGFGKTISGYGSLLRSGDTLLNYGDVEAKGGNLSVSAAVNNYGNVLSENSDSLSINNVVNNYITGTVTSRNASSISINNNVLNEGFISIENGQRKGAINMISSSGNGIYSLDEGIMSFSANLQIGADGAIFDNEVESIINISGDMSKISGGNTIFNADQILFNLFSTAIIGKHRLSWGAEDQGADPDGLINNLALGQMNFGDGTGMPKSDMFYFSDTNALYCFGLNINSDAYIDLGGSTIYYLKEGDVVNGITGLGFKNNGMFENGKIIEISALPVPEPASFLLSVYGFIFIIRSIVKSKRKF